MDHREALVSQALENSTRLERSFIEQAIFATKLEDRGFTRAEIGDVLAVDKGTLSKLIGVARDVPDAVIYKIGAAHEAGRRPWLELRRLVKTENAPSDSSVLLLVPEEGTAAEKLSAVIDALQKVADAQQNAAESAAKGPPLPRSTRCPQLRWLSGPRPTSFDQVSDKKTRFINFVETQLERLYQEWKRKS